MTALRAAVEHHVRIDSTIAIAPDAWLGRGPLTLDRAVCMDAQFSLDDPLTHPVPTMIVGAMGRGMRIAVLGAVVVGSSVGGLAAWYSTPGEPTVVAPAVAQPAAPTRPSPAPSTAAHTDLAPPMSPVVPVPDLHGAVATQMRAVLSRFADWSRDHPGAPCPDSPALGGTTLDPWGHPIALTCTDQPADQRVGAISGGADGVMGNDDDVASWTLGRDVTDLVRGARWKPGRTAPPSVAKHGKDRPASRAPAMAAPASPKTAPTTPTTAASPTPASPTPASPTPASPTPATAAAATTASTTTKPSAPPIDAGGDDIPARR